MKNFKDYIGKKAVCLASGNEVFISDSVTFQSNLPYRDETLAYDDEGEFIALLQDGTNYAEILGPNQHIIDYLEESLANAEKYTSIDDAMTYSYRYGMLRGAIKFCIETLK